MLIMDGEKMKKNKEYIIAGSLLSLAIVGMVFAYQTESDSKKAKEEDKNQVAFQEVEEDKEEEKEEVEDVSNILAAKQKEQQEQEQEAEKAEQEQETANTTPTLHFAGELEWPANGNVIMNYSMDKTVYFKSLDQYRYNPAVVIGANVNDAVTSAAVGKILEISNNEVTGCTVSVDLGDGYQAIYGQLKEVPKQAGSYVEAGEVIGYISEPTKYYSEEGSNLYFQLLKDGTPVDPMTYFQ